MKHKNRKDVYLMLKPQVSKNSQEIRSPDFIECMGRFEGHKCIVTSKKCDHRERMS